MIDETKALELFSEKYRERYGDSKMEPDDTVIAVMKNCTMSVTMDENQKIHIEFFGGKPLYIDENLFAYEEEF